jgi:hypothetical protein
VIESGIYYIKQQPGRQAAPYVLGMTGRPIRRPVGRLRFFDFHTLRITDVSELIEGIAVGLAASPNGRMVLFTTADSPTSDLVLIENVQ